MKNIFKRISIDNFIEGVIILVEYCAPVFAALGFLHLFLCNHHITPFGRAVLYVMAFTLGMSIFICYDVRKIRVRELEEKIECYKKKEETS